MVPRYLLNVCFFLPRETPNNARALSKVRPRLEAVARIPFVNQRSSGNVLGMPPRLECHADFHMNKGFTTHCFISIKWGFISSPYFRRRQRGHANCDNWETWFLGAMIRIADTLIRTPPPPLDRLPPPIGPVSVTPFFYLRLPWGDGCPPQWPACRSNKPVPGKNFLHDPLSGMRSYFYLADML